MPFSIQLTDLQAAIAWNTAIVLAFAAAFFIQWKEGRRQGFDQATWLPFLAVVYGCLVLGERAGAFTVADWQRLLAEGNLPDLAKKTALGGGLLVLPVIFCLKKWWHLPAGMLDALMLPMPLALAIGRSGCLLAGCCHGLPTESGWGLRYGQGMPAYNLQVAQGLLPDTAQASLAVYPTHLFTIAVGLLGFGLLWHLRKQAGRPGQLALLALVLLFGNRFFVEFFREAATARGLLGDVVAGLKLGQWGSLAVGLAALIAYSWRENFGAAQVSVPVAAPVCPAKVEAPERVALLLAVSLGALLFRPVLTLDEELILLFAYSPALFLLGKMLWKKRAGRPALAPTAMLSVAAVALIAVPMDTLPPMAEGQRWLELGVGGTTGAFTHITRDCDGNVVKQEKIKVRSTAFDSNFNWGLKNGRAGIGLRSCFGRTDGPETSNYTDFHFTALGVYGIFEKKAFGIRLGNLFINEDAGEGNLPVNGGSNSLEYWPILDLRLGKINQVNFYLSTFEGNAFSYFPEPAFSMGLGYGFKDPSGASQLRGGLAVVNGESAFSIACRAPIFQSPWSLDGGIFLSKNTMFSMGVRRRLYLKK